MSEKIVQLNEEVIKGQLKELVRGNVEETLNGLLEAEAKNSPKLDDTNAANSVRDTEAVIITAASRQLLERLRFRYRVSKEFPLRLHH